VLVGEQQLNRVILVRTGRVVVPMVVSRREGLWLMGAASQGALLREQVWLVNSRVVAGRQVVVAWNGGAISRRSRCDKRGPVLALHILVVGFPLLECGPTGPRARAPVFGADSNE
jgi:hypothetical protein